MEEKRQVIGESGELWRIIKVYARISICQFQEVVSTVSPTRDGTVATHSRSDISE